MLSRNLCVVTDKEIKTMALGISLVTRRTELAGMKFVFISYLITFLGVIHFSGKSQSFKHAK